MVNAEIPKHYTGSPSSFAGTPQLTINRDVTADLDSTFAFEGPEKLLEVWFSASPTTLPAQSASKGLKSVPVETWKDMLDLVNCKVLSIVESDNVDAYLLSESSMFVFPHKLILKTWAQRPYFPGFLEFLRLQLPLPNFLKPIIPVLKPTELSLQSLTGCSTVARISCSLIDSVDRIARGETRFAVWINYSFAEART